MRCDITLEIGWRTSKLTGKKTFFCASMICSRCWQCVFFLLNWQTKRDLEKLVDEINAGRPQCPVGLNTLVIPRKVTLGEHINQPYVYLNCGHVQGKKISKKRSFFSNFSEINFLVLLGNHDWGQDKSTGARRCPMCLELGPVVTLCMGIEPAFYVDSGPPSYAFNPCGHMASEASVK